MARKTGLILLNLGTPASPHPKDVGVYLREFLMDPLVVDIPYALRWMLVNLLIVPRRSVASGKLYEKIWTPEGSPLLIYTLSLARKVAAEMPDWEVAPAMRYGQPSITAALSQMRDSGVDSLVVFPLYPQFSLAATESSEREVRRLAAKILPGVKLVFVEAFYDDHRYLDAVKTVSEPLLDRSWFTLFSFHGLPERQVKKTDLTGRHCLAVSSCCDRMSAANACCYRAQSYATARGLAQRLQLEPGRWDVAFQSRLGTTPWIRPYSDAFYEALPAQGVKHLNVLTPSFTADCLETLEEVQMRGEEAFRKAGGETLRLIPSLNDHPAWIRAVRAIAEGYQPKT